MPEWRYFDEQVEKARALARAGVAVQAPGMPASAQAWRGLIARARRNHRPDLQRSMVRPDAAAQVADWLETLIDRLDAPLSATTCLGKPTCRI